MKNSFAANVNELSILKYFSFRMVTYYFRRLPKESTKCVNLADRMSEIRAYYPIYCTMVKQKKIFYVTLKQSGSR